MGRVVGPYSEIVERASGDMLPVGTNPERNRKVIGIAMLELLAGIANELAVDSTKLREAVRKAEQLASVATDWNLTEVEIDGEMVSVYELREEFEAVSDGLD